jgi:hypothetical protein
MILEKPKTKKNKQLIQAIRKLNCSSCGKTPPSDASHIRSKGAGGPDTVWNLFPKCRDCHQEWHRVGWKTFIQKHPHFGLKLVGSGWILDSDLLGLWHPELGAKDDA